MATDKSAEQAAAEAKLAALIQEAYPAPKGLGQGVTRGVSHIVQGAVGAAGVAVVAPLAGLALGTQRGGLLGGAFGVAGGAVVGALGAAGLLVHGAVAGVTSIVKGVVAAPKAALAPSQGQWWNEVEHRWVTTDLPRDQAAVLPEGVVPDDDSDLLQAVTDELDASAELASGKNDSGDVVDTFYYDTLQVAPTADEATLRRKYYLLARQYHPDRNPNDAAAADKFKDVAEAYQVLSDPALRKRYDQVGKDGLSGDKTEATNIPPAVDPALLFAFLFGSDRFHPYVGRMAAATSAAVGDSPKISVQDARTLQKRRVTRLALRLVDKIRPWVEVSLAGDGQPDVLAAIEAEWRQEAVDLGTASYGYEMVTNIGKIYQMLAVQYQGSINSGLGLPSVAAWAERQKATMDKKAYTNQTKMDGLKAAMDMMKLQMEYKQKMEASSSADERDALHKELEEASLRIQLRVLWTATVVDLTSTLYEVTHMVFFDQSVDKDTRRLRAQAVQTLGEIWTTALPDDDAAGTEDADARKLYEEAALAAMLETVKRKDAASASSA